MDMAGYYGQRYTNRMPAWREAGRRTEAYDRGVCYFPDREVLVSGGYVLVGTFNGRETYLTTRRQIENWRRAAREFPEDFKVEAWREPDFYAPACLWCGARPQARDWDCDGQYWTADCKDIRCGGVDGHRLLAQEQE